MKKEEDNLEEDNNLMLNTLVDLLIEEKIIDEETFIKRLNKAKKDVKNTREIEEDVEEELVNRIEDE